MIFLFSNPCYVASNQIFFFGNLDSPFNFLADGVTNVVERDSGH